MNRLQQLLLTTQLLFICLFSLANTSMRCNTELVHVGATIEEVANKCGTPDDRITWEETGYYAGVYSGSSPLEDWYYTPPLGSQGYYVLHFKDRKLLSIEYKVK